MLSFVVDALFVACLFGLPAAAIGLNYMRHSQVQVEKQPLQPVVSR